MDKTGVCVSSSRSFSDELLSVYEHIGAYRITVNTRYERTVTKNKFGRVVGIAGTALLIFIGLLLAAMYLLPIEIWVTDTGGIRLGLQLAVLAIYLLGPAIILLQFFSLKKDVTDFTGQIIDIGEKLAKNEAVLFEALNELSTESIQYVANTLDQSSNQLRQLRSFLLGAIEKVGIIPGLIATALAISKVAETTGFSWIEMLSFGLLGIYLTMFPITTASIRTKRLSDLLNQYLVFFRFSDGSKEIQNERQHN